MRAVRDNKPPSGKLGARSSEVIASDSLTLIAIPAWEVKQQHKILRIVDDEWLTI